MTKQEKRITDVEKRVDSLEAVFKSFMQEMRDRDNQRAADIREYRRDMKAMNESIGAKIDYIGKQVRNMCVATVICLAAVEIALIYSILTR